LPIKLEEHHLTMTETIPTRAFNDVEAIAWLRSRPDGRVTASAAELARQWGLEPDARRSPVEGLARGRHIRRNAEEIIVTTSVTPTVTEAPGATVTRRSKTFVKLATFIVALALACVSAAFSIDGLTAIFAGAFWPVITMGATLEAGKLVAAAWLAENWHSAPFLLRLILVAMIIGVLMSLNAVGVFGFLTRAHLDHTQPSIWRSRTATADAEARLAIQGQTVADLDRRIAQIDAAIEESTRLGRPVSAMTIADQKRRNSLRDKPKCSPATPPTPITRSAASFRRSRTWASSTTR
jgi:hypothetical protein